MLVAKAQNCLSSVQESLRQLVMCLGRKVWLFWYKEAGLSAQHPVVKDLLTHEHILYHLVFAESNVDKQ